MYSDNNTQFTMINQNLILVFSFTTKATSNFVNAQSNFLCTIKLFIKIYNQFIICHHLIHVLTGDFFRHEMISVKLMPKVLNVQFFSRFLK